jgi:Uma2 family endonuclease
MAAILNETENAIAFEPAEARVVLRNISWETYERMLEDLADCSAPRLTYDQGDLEIMSPQAQHEVINETIKLFLSLVSLELEIEIRGLGSTTFRREDAERGFEADSCFYLQNEALIRGKDRIELPTDPPPDLVFEVDITSSSLDKDSIFAQLGVPEVWRYDGSTLEILVLSGDSYKRSPASSALPFITADVVTNFIVEGSKLSRLEWIKAVQTWVRQQKSSGSSK